MAVRVAMNTLAELARYARLHAGWQRRPRGMWCARPDAKTHSNLVVSLSTIPSRIHAILPAIRSLLDQTLVPETILVAIPRHSIREHRAYEIPTALRNVSRVSILPTEHDWGPATKILPALRHFAHEPDRPIVLVDDDNIYPTTLLETLAHHAEQMPTSAIALRGYHVPPSRKFQDATIISGPSLPAPVRVDVVTGCGGVLVRPRFFDDRVFGLVDQSHAFYTDDAWLSAHLAMKGVPAYVVPLQNGRVYWKSIATWVGHALDREENRHFVHDDAILSEFGDLWPSHAKAVR